MPGFPVPPAMIYPGGTIAAKPSLLTNGAAILASDGKKLLRPRSISGSIAWSIPLALAAPLTAIVFDCRQSSAPMEQIAGMFVDNSASDADVSFLFADSGFVLVVPARNEGWYAVETQALVFIVSSPQASAADVVNFQVYNYLPPPVSINPPQLVSASVTQGVALASGTTSLIAAPTSGIVTAAQVSYSGGTAGAAGGSIAVSIADGTPVAFAGGNLTFAANAVIPNSVLINLQPVAWRFRNGLNLVVTVAGTMPGTGGLTANILFR